MPHRYETGYEIGQDNIRNWGMDIHNPVFFSSSILIITFVVSTLLAPNDASLILGAVAVSLSLICVGLAGGGLAALSAAAIASADSSMHPTMTSSRAERATEFTASASEMPPTFISCALPLLAPISGRMPWTSAISSAPSLLRSSVLNMGPKSFMIVSSWVWPHWVFNRPAGSSLETRHTG